MSKAVCSNCGSDTLYQEVEVTTADSRPIDVSYTASGELDVSEGSLEGDGYFLSDLPGEYVCAGCGRRDSRLSGLVTREADSPAGVACCCGHARSEHPENRFNPKTHTRGAMPCAEPGCGCWEFETDPAFATVAASAA